MYVTGDLESSRSRVEANFIRAERHGHRLKGSGGLGLSGHFRRAREERRRGESEREGSGGMRGYREAGEESFSAGGWEPATGR